MAMRKRFIKKAKTNDVDPQNLFLEDDARVQLVEEFKAIGTRRILVVCDNTIRRIHIFEEMLNIFDEAGFRVFVYCQTGRLLMDRDIEGGLKIYREYNCDTIVAIGGSAELDCGKLIAANANIPIKSVSQLANSNKISEVVPPLCCIVTENCISASTSSAEFFDNNSKQWKMVTSKSLVPHMVVIDPDFSERVLREVAINSALSALCITIESYINPIAPYFPEYRASSIIACSSIFKNLEKYSNNSTDNFLRKQIAIGGFYSGLSSRKTGIGYAHLIMHSFINRYGVVHGTGFVKILVLVLQAQLKNEAVCDALAELARASHFCSVGLSNRNAAESLINNLERLYDKVGDKTQIPYVEDREIDLIVNEVEREARKLVISRDIDSRELRNIVAAFSD